MKNKFVILIVLAFIIGTGYFFVRGFNQKSASTHSSSQSPTSNDSKPQVIKTIPDPLDNIIIPANQVIEISFNKPLQNAPEFKVRFEPVIEFKVELSSDRKTAKIIPAKPFELGAAYTLYIGRETKFDGVGEWGEDKAFHFQTIKYRGI